MWGKRTWEPSFLLLQAPPTALLLPRRLFENSVIHFPSVFRPCLMFPPLLANNPGPSGKGCPAAWRGGRREPELFTAQPEKAQAYLKSRPQGHWGPPAGCVGAGKGQGAIPLHRNLSGLPALCGVPALSCGVSFFVSPQLGFPFWVTDSSGIMDSWSREKNTGIHSAGSLGNRFCVLLCGNTRAGDEMAGIWSPLPPAPKLSGS